MNNHQPAVDTLDADVVLELILQGYHVAHLEQPSNLHRLARETEQLTYLQEDNPAPC